MFRTFKSNTMLQQILMIATRGITTQEPTEAVEIYFITSEAPGNDTVALNQLYDH